jgi:hypothetical protein
MNAILRNIIAVLVGIVSGSILNGAIINISSSIIPPPAGVDITTEEGLKATIHLFEPINFLMPFLAHALGTFLGALICVIIAVTHHIELALGVGFIFLLGGIMMVVMLPSPLWFNALDLLGAYIPMAYLAAKILKK